jgi:hypothetical protein
MDWLFDLNTKSLFNKLIKKEPKEILCNIMELESHLINK